LIIVKVLFVVIKSKFFAKVRFFNGYWKEGKEKNLLMLNFVA